MTTYEFRNGRRESRVEPKPHFLKGYNVTLVKGTRWSTVTSIRSIRTKAEALKVARAWVA